MSDIPFTGLMSKLLEIEEENDEIYHNNEEEEEEEADEFSDLSNNQKNEEEEEECDDNKIIGIIKSKTFKPIIFDKYENIIGKCRKRICSSATISAYNAWRYCQKYFCFNVPLLFYILIDNLKNDHLSLVKTCEIFRYIFQNFNHNEVIDNLQTAIYYYHEKPNEISDIHIILLQVLVSTFVLTINEAKVLLRIFMGPDASIEYDQIFSEQLKYPRQETLNYNKEKPSFRSQLMNIKAKLDEMYNVLEKTKADLPSGSNDIIQELILQDTIQKHKRKYSSKFLAICSLAYIFGSKCYSFLRNFLALPHETTIRKWFSPDIHNYVEYLTDKKNIPRIINEFVPMDNSLNHFTISIDAAKLKEVSGKSIRKKFPLIQNIEDNKIYNNIFIFYMQNFNSQIKPFPLYVLLAENGAANDETLDNIIEILEIIEKINISIHFLATDGDHKFDHFHDQFFSIILDGFKSKMTYDDLILNICRHNIKQFPISDFLHSIKNLRTYLIKYGVEIDLNSKTTILPENLKNFDIGKAVSDMTQKGKMKDNYPFEIFAQSHIIKAIENNNWEFVFYALPINLIINAIRNPYLSNSIRKYFFETAFYFLMKIFYEMRSLKSPMHSRIGIIRMINTIVGLSVALEIEEFLKMGNISSHPLENFFGFLRLACNYDHSATNIFRAIAKSIYIKKTLSNYDLNIDIRTRLSYAGTVASYEKVGGVVPPFSPFELFRIIFKKMRDPSFECHDFINWYINFKTEPWDERISASSDLSGSSIVSRYISSSNNTKQKNAELKKKKMEKYYYIRTLQRSYGFNAEEENALNSDSMVDFLHIIYGPVNCDLSTEESDLSPKDYMVFHCEKFLKGLKKWNSHKFSNLKD